MGICFLERFGISVVFPSTFFSYVKVTSSSKTSIDRKDGRTLRYSAGNRSVKMQTNRTYREHRVHKYKGPLWLALQKSNDGVFGA